MANPKDSVVTELDKRLEDLFGEDFSEDALNKPPVSPLPRSETHEESKPVFNAKKAFSQKISVARSPIEALDGFLLALDWELDDKTLSKYLDEIQKVRQAYLEDKIVVHFFQMLDSLARYLHSRKVKAHPETVRMMQEIQEGLGQILNPQKMLSREEKKTVLKNSYGHFQRFKELISTTAPHRKTVKRQNGPEEKTDSFSSADGALQDLIRKILREEFEDFRKKLLRDIMGTK